MTQSSLALLNLSYKILAKALVVRIKHLLPKFIQHEQIGFIKGHYALDNIVVVWEGWEWARSSDLDALFIKIDFEKAVYGKVEWPFILAILKAMGFGPYFIQSVETLFVDASACLSINHGKSKAINMFFSIW